MANEDWMCAGTGQCHGPLSWCDTCGDVDRVCPHPGCMSHYCTTCQAGPTSIHDYQCEGCIDQDAIEFEESEMLRHAERGDHVREARHRARFEALVKNALARVL